MTYSEIKPFTSLSNALNETKKAFEEYKQRYYRDFAKVDKIRAKKKERRLRRKARGPRK